MDIVNAYQTLGTYRGAAALCGTTHKTVKRVLDRRQRDQVGRRSARPPKTAGVAALIEERLRLSDGRISAKRLLPVAQAAGYAGSLRTLQRAVKAAKTAWKLARRRYRPWLPTPGQHLVFDWTSEAGWQCFCAVLAWSRIRFVRFARDQKRETTQRFLAECFEELQGVPAVALTDRMACLRAGVVANVVVPHPEYVCFAAHYGFQPDFCEAADPESKGVVEALAGYVQRDLIRPALMDGGWPDEASANAAARAWCAEVNAQVHSEIAAVPAERLRVEQFVLRPLPSLRPPLRSAELRKVDRLGMVRFGAARYAVPQELVGRLVEVRADDGAVIISAAGTEVVRHLPVAPGEVALGSLALEMRRPARAVRPRTAIEIAFLSLGPSAEAFIRAAAAAGTLRLESELSQIVALEAAWGHGVLVKALERALRFRRFKARDLRAILAAGSGVPMPTVSGAQLGLALPPVPERPLSAYALAGIGGQS
jgi:transposase